MKNKENKTRDHGNSMKKNRQDSPLSFHYFFKWNLIPVATWRLQFLGVFVVFFSLITVLFAQPQWWADRGVIDGTMTEEDRGILNQGQLKHITSKAIEELNEKLPGGAGTVLNTLLIDWIAGHPDSDDTAMMNLGQIKYVASLVYARLIEEGRDDPLVVGDNSTKPSALLAAWSAPGASDNDNALANIGQVKYLFSFNLSAFPDQDGDGLDDNFEQLIIDAAIAAGDTTNDTLEEVLPGEDYDQDGYTNLQEYESGNDPVVPRIDEEMIGHWKFEESSGNTAEDETDFNYDATLMGGTYRSVSVDGGVIGFDGINDYAAIQGLSYNQAGSIEQLTVAFWIKTTDLGSNAIVDFDRSEYWSVGINFHDFDNNNGGDGKISWGTAGEGSNIQDMLSSVRVDDGEWHHICVVFDTNEVNEKKIYIDGVLDNEADQYPTGVKLGTGVTRYGFFGDGSEATTFNGSRNHMFYEGELDEVRIYNQALAESDIQRLIELRPSDLDQDNLPDDWEQQIIDAAIAVGDTTNDTLEEVLPGEDYDQDGYTNLQEYESGNDPVVPRIDEEMIGHWKFEESGGNTAEDETDFNYDATLMGGAYRSVSVDGSGAIGFDGSNDYAAIQGLSYDQAGSIEQVTVAFWIKTTDPGSNAIVDFDRSEYWSVGINFHDFNNDNGGDGKISWGTASEGANIQDMLSSVRVDDGKWHHVCVVFDTNEINEKKIYIDGVLDSEADQYATGIKLGTGDTRYGFFGDGSEATTFNGSRNHMFYGGELDEVRIYNQALAESDIQRLMELQVPDLDQDGISDLWEQQIIDGDPNDNIETIDDVLPGDDFDNDGLINRREYELGTNPTDPYNDGQLLDVQFEILEGYSLGAVDGQLNWEASEGVEVSTSQAVSGTQSLELNGTDVSVERVVPGAASESTIEMKLYLSPDGTFSEADVYLPEIAASIVAFDPSQGLMAFDGNGDGTGNWVVVPDSLLIGQWVTVTIVEDYSAKTWSVLIDGVEKLTNQGFKDNSVTALSRIRFEKHANGLMFIDDVKATDSSN